MTRIAILACSLTLLAMFACRQQPRQLPAAERTVKTQATVRPGEPLGRRGDEIVVCGKLFHTTTPVVLWMDRGGYDAYRVQRRFAPLDKSSWRLSRAEVRFLRTPNRYGTRRGLTSTQRQLVRGGGWPLKLLRDKVDQFVIHYDVCGTSRRCFKVLHDMRGLSVHFMLDIDGTIYQTLDLKERAWHATIANDRSIGIEIANIGAYSPQNVRILNQWYRKDKNGKPRIKLPKSMGNGGVRTKNFVGRPERGPLTGVVQGTKLVQYDLTPQQYDALIKLTATLCRVFPKMKCDFPRDEQGQLVTKKLSRKRWQKFQGVLGHYHVQPNKVDPGPAFQWERVVREAKKLMR